MSRDPFKGIDPRSPEDIAKAAAKQRERQLAYAKQAEAAADKYRAITSAEAHEAWLNELNRPVEGAVRTGWAQIDSLLGRPIGVGEVCVIAARTGVGKTWILQHIVHRKLKADKAAAVLFMTMEMPEHEMAHRVAAQVLMMSPAAVEERAKEGLVKSGEAFVQIDAPELRRLAYYPRPNTPVDDIAKIIEANDDLHPSIVVVDYMGLLGGGRGQGTYDRASQNARDLKELAKGYNVTVLAAVQLSRGGGRDGAYEPQLDALRDSGVIEEAADRVLMFWRESESENLSNVRIFAKVAKNRHGLIGGRVMLRFNDWLELIEVPLEDQYAVASE